MKFAPLIWAGLWRKPAEALLTWVAVVSAFTLFGLMVGLHTTARRAIDDAREDRLYVNQRFFGPSIPGLPIAIASELARIDGVQAVGAFNNISGYCRDPGKFCYVFLMDEGMREGYSELPLTPWQWDRLFAHPTGVFLSRKQAAYLQLKEGDTLPLVAQPGSRADGGTNWPFEVLGVVDDHREWESGFILGNFHYVDSARPRDRRGYVGGFRVATRGANASEVARRIDRLFASSSSPTISISTKAALVAMEKMRADVTSMSLAVAGAGLFMILFLTANGIAQSVRERIPQFALLETIGFRRPQITALIVAEAAIPCVVGAIVGIGIAAALTRVPRRMLYRPLADVLTSPTVSPFVFACALGFALLLALIGSLVPVLKLRRLSIVDALVGR